MFRLAGCYLSRICGRLAVDKLRGLTSIRREDGKSTDNRDIAKSLDEFRIVRQ